MVRLLIVDNKTKGSQLVARILAHKLQSNPSSVFGFATGSSPIDIYKQLSSWTLDGKLDWSLATSFNLDEYIGLDKDDPNSYHKFMHENLFDNINLRSINLLNGTSQDLEEEAQSYERKIQDKMIDIQLLGIGENAHIGFNEPSSSFQSRTRVVELTPSTLNANQKYFEGEDQPTRAITMGLGTILESKEIILVAWGKEKSNAVEKSILFNRNINYPASCLLTHSNCQFIIDREAARDIPLKNKLIFSMYNSICWRNEQSYKILVFSPHQDDDVIAMGATMNMLRQLNHSVGVAYQTSGFNGIPTIPKEKAKFVRKVEAINALSKLNIDQAFFLDSNFYENGEHEIQEDINSHIVLIEEQKPDVIFCCGDFNDPHGTHKKCTTILLEALKESRHIPREIWLYKGAWENYSITEVDLVIPFDEPTQIIKTKSILEHVSQLNPVYKGSDDRQFWKRAEERCKNNADLINVQLDTCLKYVEMFQHL